MQTIVFIETNKSGSSREAIKAAERLGYLTVLLTNRKKYLQQREEFSEVHNMFYIETMDVKSFREKILFMKKTGKQVVAVLSFIDPFVHPAAQLSEEFGQTKMDPQAIFKMEDKVETRKTLEGLVYSPFFTVFQPTDNLETFTDAHSEQLPLIVKSPQSTGSKDVLLAEDKEQLSEAIQALIVKYPKESVLIEEFLDGPQYLVEALVQNNNVYIIGIIEQEISKQERFIVTGYGLLAEVEEEMNKSIKLAVENIIKAFEMKNGACHLELRLVNGEWKLIEINPRISGGVMNRLIEVGFGINLVEETIKLYLGQEVSADKQHNKFAYAYYMTVQSQGTLKKVTGVKRASRYEGVDDIYIKPRKGMLISPPLSMAHRYGYVLASSNSIEKAEQIAKNAANEIQFHINDELI